MEILDAWMPTRFPATPLITGWNTAMSGYLGTEGDQTHAVQCEHYSDLPRDDAVEDLSPQAGDHHSSQHRAPAVPQYLTGVRIGPGNGAAHLSDQSQACVSVVDQSEAWKIMYYTDRNEADVDQEDGDNDGPGHDTRVEEAGHRRQQGEGHQVPQGRGDGSGHVIRVDRVAAREGDHCHHHQACSQ